MNDDLLNCYFYDKSLKTFAWISWEGHKPDMDLGSFQFTKSVATADAFTREKHVSTGMISHHKYIYINRLRWQQSFVFISFYLSSTFPQCSRKDAGIVLHRHILSGNFRRRCFYSVDLTLYNMVAFSFEESAFAPDFKAKSIHSTYSVALRFVFLLIFQ